MSELIGWEPFIEGLNILRHAVPRKKQYLAADRAIIWVAAAEDVDLDTDSISRLEALGFFIDETNDCWAYFV